MITRYNAVFNDDHNCAEMRSHEEGRWVAYSDYEALANQGARSENGIGDVHSNERGSGARYNEGKTAIELIPLRIIAEQKAHVGLAYSYSAEIAALHELALFQEGGDEVYLLRAISIIGAAWDECAAVFNYGRRKYAEWNWAKGMAWSIPIACAARHLIFGMMKGEVLDPESGLPHRGHFLCNVVMLLTFARTYPEGDDRPSQWLRDASMTEHAARETDARLIAESNQEVADADQA